MTFRQTLHKALYQGAGEAARSALSALLPHACISCGVRVVGAGGFCPSCWAGLVPITAQMADAEGLPMPFMSGPRTGTNRSLPSQTQVRLRAAVVFNDVARSAVHKLKYQDRHEVAAPMVRLMAASGADMLAAADYVLPVPLHAGRAMRRRYNQAALLAAPLARQFGKPYAAGALLRTRATRAQVGLSGAARVRNTDGAFQLAQTARDYLAERHLLLIDDVITTGATVRACARTLLDAGAARVDVLAFARALPREQ